VAPDHFRTAPWAAAGPLRFVHYTCIACGHRSPDYGAFRAHRPTCEGHFRTQSLPEWARSPADELSDDDRQVLGALLDDLTPEAAEVGS
jgi:hypothetical protein